MQNNIERFIVEPEHIGSMDSRAPESVFELETMLAVVRQPINERDQLLRQLWDYATQTDSPITNTLAEGYLERGIISDQELEAHYQRMSQWRALRGI